MSSTSYSFMQICVIEKFAEQSASTGWRLFSGGMSGDEIFHYLDQNGNFAQL